MAYAIYKLPQPSWVKAADYEPENKKLEWWLTIITSVGVAAMLAPGLFVWAKFVDVPEDADIVEVVGQQWHWSYRYPGEDGKLGTTDANLITLDNPFGMNPEDPSGQDDVLVMHTPSCTCRSTGRSSCCCAPKTCCTTLPCRSFA